MTVAQAAVVNQALQEIGAQTQITDLNDGSPAGNAAGAIYAPIVQMVLRQLDPDFARLGSFVLALLGSGGLPYAFEYAYPADCLRTRQVMPPLTYDPLDPQPIRWAVAFDAGLARKVILTNQVNARLVYTTSSPTEALWDNSFRETVVRHLASPLAMAVAGRPDFAKSILEQAMQIAQMAEGHDDGV